MNEDPWVREPRERVCAVMVTYHPDDGCAARLRRVIPQAGAVLVIDNASSDEELRLMRDLCGSPSAALICNDHNLGIATALNIGVRRAREGGFGWALLLDQDTEVDADMVDRLLSALGSCPDRNRVAVVGSRFRDPRGQSIESMRRGDRGEQWQEVESVITSGCLLSLTAYAAVGPFRDEFFIDYVDTEYCFRARAAGYLVIETVRPLMSHSLGAPTAHKLLWATMWTSNHPPDRRYYMARNNTVLLREYGTSGRGPWQWKSLVRCIRLCKRIAYFERDKLRKIAAVAQGWLDALRGRMGPRPGKLRP